MFTRCVAVHSTTKTAAGVERVERKDINAERGQLKRRDEARRLCPCFWCVFLGKRRHTQRCRARLTGIPASGLALFKERHWTLPVSGSQSSYRVDLSV